MKDTEYTFAVAHIRSNESKLLSTQDIASVIAANGYDEAVRRLNDKGYEIVGKDYSAALDKKINVAWELISSVLPDRSQFDSIIIENDFQNLKVMLKSLICEKSSAGFVFSPSVYSPEIIKSAVENNENSLMPTPLQHAHRSAYRILTQTRFAQLADSVIDRAALEWSIKTAEKADNRIMSDIAECKAACTDIKILYRCIKAGKSKSFMERCVCECKAFSKKDIIDCASDSMDCFIEFLLHTSYSGAADALKEGATAFEKWCDDRMLEILRVAKTEVFGIAPIAAYYYAVAAEVRNIRMILSAKLNGMPDDTVRERVRELYV